MSKIAFTDYVLAGSLLLLSIYLGYFTQQEDFRTVCPALCLFFGGFYWIYRKTVTQKDIYFFVLAGIGVRIALIPAFPNWSDDIYRFLWDGYLWNAGFNPFDHLPTYYLEQDLSIQGITPELYNRLNSPNYFTIYPPVCQGIFAFATWLFPSSWSAAAITMKVILVAMETGSIWLIISLLRNGFMSTSTSLKPVLLYALNPLVIFEISGNLHFEGPMVFFLLLAFWLLKKERLNWSALAWALSVASKLLTLLFLPFLIRRLGWKKSFIYFSITGISTLLFFLPILSMDFFQNFGNSLDLYFRKFEFNASIYYLTRWVGYQFAGYNIIQQAGPILAFTVFLGILTIVVLEKKPSWKNFPRQLLFAILLYLFLALTIHPWYVILPIVFCLFTNFRFPVLWSGLIMLTYINYSYDEYWENLWVVGLEYGILFCAILYEFNDKKRSKIA